MISVGQGVDQPCSTQAAKRVGRQCPDVDVRIFSDRDFSTRQAEVEEALRGADVFFGSLLFDYDQVWNACHVVALMHAKLSNGGSPS
jgi:hypothetical protein